MNRREDLTLVNYCHRDCESLLNIMRLSREQAFALVKQLAEAQPNVRSFGRFVVFPRCYELRLAQDAALYEGFHARGGKPEERHPLSFVPGGSDCLRQ